jgi:hypothetical protein
LKQQTEALKQQNAFMEQQQRAALLAAPAPTQFIPAVRKPRIDDIDTLTGKPRFGSYAHCEDAKDEWLIKKPCADLKPCVRPKQRSDRRPGAGPNRRRKRVVDLTFSRLNSNDV